MRHLSCVAPQAWRWSDQLVTEAVMRALGMIMRKIVLDHSTPRPLGQHHPLRPSFLLDGAPDPCAVSLQVGAPRWEEDRL
jgi:hypothetical protein